MIKTTTRYVLQAYLSVSPRYPQWSEVEVTAVNGWTRYFRRTHDARLVKGTTRWEFRTPEGAVEVLHELQKLPQEYHLRVARIVTTKDTYVLAGSDIKSGTLVDGPGDNLSKAREPFWKIEPETIARIVPASKVKPIALGGTEHV